MMRQMWQMGAASVALVMLAGCAGRVPAQAGLVASPTATTPAYTTPSYTTPGYTDPYSSTNPYGTTTPYGSTSPYGTTGSYSDPYGTGTTMPTAAQQLVATVDNIKNGSFLGLGKFVVTIKVTNPANVQQSGTLKVSIMSSGKSIKDFNDPVTVPPLQSITVTKEDTRWKADNATVSIIPTTTADPYAAYNTGTSSAYGSTTPYGSTATGPYGY